MLLRFSDDKTLSVDMYDNLLSFVVKVIAPIARSRMSHDVRDNRKSSLENLFGVGNG